MDVRLPDGTVISGVPDNITKAELVAKLKANGYDTSGLEPASVNAGGALNQIPRQVGLTARSALQGLGGSAEIVTEPIRQIALRGSGEPLSKLAGRFADSVGLPSPQTADERTVSKATELGFGGAGMVGATRTGANVLTGVARDVMGKLSAGPATQVAAGAGAGAAGQASEEAGGTPLQQTGAAVVGGLGGAGVAGLANMVRDGAKSLGARVTAAMKPESIDIQVKSILKRGGQDWDTLPLNVRNALRDELKAAVSTGKDLDPQAVGRLADFMRVGATPTRGTVSLDPVQITREKNLSKIGANSGDGSLQGLARIENENNTALINALNKQGAGNVSALDAGRSAVDSILGKDAQMGRGVSALYREARDMPGGDTPLAKGELINNIFANLARENKMAFLPAEVGTMLNTISKGTTVVNGVEYPVPFTANTLDNLMTTIATAQRGSKDGNVRAALGLVRDAIENTQIAPVKRDFGGSQLVTPGVANQMQAADAAPGQFMDALNKAREAARNRFGWQESSRPISGALDGMEPDGFINKFVIGGTVADAKSVAENAPKSAVRDALLTHLKDKALSGATDEVGKFSQSAFNKALKSLGDEKLALFFSPDEIAQLKAVGRVASYTQVQPVGSAVNNSNSGALIGGRAVDLLNGLAGKIPFGRQAIVEPVVNIGNSLAQRSAQKVLPGLIVDPQKDPAINKLMLPALGAAGLLAFD